MNSTSRWTLAAVLAGSSLALGDGFQNPPEGAAAIGKAGVAVVFVEGPSAVSHNPAALTGLDAPALDASLTLGYSKTEYSSSAGDAQTEAPVSVLPNVYFAAPLDKHGLVGAVSLTTPFGQSTEWEKDGVFRYSVPYFSQLALVDAAATVAKKYERLSVGVGLDIYSAQLTMRQVVPWGATLEAPGLPDGKIELEGDGSALGAHVGLLYQVCDRSVLGLMWRTGFSMELEGDTSLDGLPPGLPLPISPRSDFNTEVEFPNLVILGYGVEASDALRLSARVEWIEHSAYQDLALDLSNNSPLLPQATIPQNWEDTWVYGVGADWTYAEGRVLRAGYSFVPSPIPDRTFSPTLPDSDRQVIGVGWGAKAGQGWWDLAYSYSLMEDRDIRDNQNPAFNGHYELDPHLLAISYRRTF